MGAARVRLAEVLLRSPIRLGSLRGMPAVGSWFHRLSHRLLPSDELIWTRVRHGPAKGTWLELNPRTGHDYAKGCAEEAVQKVLAGFLKPGMVFYDLGANIGFFSMLASRLVGKQGKVFSFEPDPVAVLRLRRNVEWNKVTNVAVVEAGVGSTTGKFAFLSSDSTSPDRGAGKFVETDGTSSGELLQRYALDDFVLRFPSPDAIKCDVEGSEVDMIRGARKLLVSCRPWIILEVHSKKNGHEARRLFEDLGYKICGVDNLHFLAEP